MAFKLRLDIQVLLNNPSMSDNCFSTSSLEALIPFDTLIYLLVGASSEDKIKPMKSVKIQLSCFGSLKLSLAPTLSWIPIFMPTRRLEVIL